MINKLKFEYIFSTDSNPFDPYFIAEVGVNHEGSFETALEQVRLAKLGGADAVKFQYYKSDLIASKNAKAYWDLSKEKTTSQRDLFKKYDNFGFKEYSQICQYCNDLDIDFILTPFHSKAIEEIDNLVETYKIASADITNFDLISSIAETGKPIILSTGASYYSEIMRAIELIKKYSNCKIAILHCTLSYPTKDSQANLNRIIELRRRFNDIIVGYSDHTVPNDSLSQVTVSSLLGARIIEKHFTHDKLLPGNDHYHSADIYDLKKIKNELLYNNLLIGSGNDVLDIEFSARKNARRMVCASKKLKKGKNLTNADIMPLRSSVGIPWEFSELIIGRKLVIDIDEGVEIDLAHVE
ncbi:N-acetylneuraminate synthase family protein [Candidatus Pseudothioglobus singularis]|nr:N-acetylneuraminate synthase family protein [Candidatus Pseudothioglobus singularis]MDB4822109.1 N-acetylneuraminate synthase family protein [Candidatus Pseudothioglobus singularis]